MDSDTCFVPSTNVHEGGAEGGAEISAVEGGAQIEEIIQFCMSDGNILSVSKHIVNYMITIREMIKDLGDNIEPIPISDIISTYTMKKVLEFIPHIKDNILLSRIKNGFDNSIDKLPETYTFTVFENHFFTSLESTPQKKELFNIVNAANYLNIPALLELTCYRISTLINGKTPKEIRECLGIENDLTDDDLLQIQHENAFEENNAE